MSKIFHFPERQIFLSLYLELQFSFEGQLKVYCLKFLYIIHRIDYYSGSPLGSCYHFELHLFFSFFTFEPSIVTTSPLSSPLPPPLISFFPSYDCTSAPKHLGTHVLSACVVFARSTCTVYLILNLLYFIVHELKKDILNDRLVREFLSILVKQHSRVISELKSLKFAPLKLGNCLHGFFITLFNEFLRSASFRHCLSSQLKFLPNSFLAKLLRFPEHELLIHFRLNSTLVCVKYFHAFFKNFASVCSLDFCLRFEN